MKANRPDRCFVAVQLSESARRSIAGIQDRLKSAGISASWEAIEKLHVTIRFLGDTTPEARQRLEELLPSLAQNFSPLDFLLHTLGAFPDLRRPRVLWVGALHTEAIVHLGKSVEEVCQAAGWPPERRTFHAHTTIARVKSFHNTSNLTEVLKSITFDPVLHRSMELVLMKSDLLQGGSQYTTLTSYPFHRFRSIP